MSNNYLFFQSTKSNKKHGCDLSRTSFVLLFGFVDYNEDKKKPKEPEKKEDITKSQEEKKKHIKNLINRIPTEKTALFNYYLDWAAVDNVSLLDLITSSC